MAVFAGTGSLILRGTEQKVYDCEFVGGSGLVADSAFNADIKSCLFWFGSAGITIDATQHVRISDSYFGEPITIDGNSLGTIITNNTFDATTGIALIATQRLVIVGNRSSGVLVAGNTSGPLTVVGNQVYTTGGYVIDVAIDATHSVAISDNTISQGSIRVDGSAIGGRTNVAITGNTIRGPSEHGIHLIFADRATIGGNNIASGAGVTFDGIIVEDSDGVLTDHNQITVLPGGSLRYGINVAGGDDNIVVGNNLGASTDYDTAPIGDSGTNTVLTYPGGTYGDNFST